MSITNADKIRSMTDKELAEFCAIYLIAIVIIASQITFATNTILPLRVMASRNG